MGRIRQAPGWAAAALVACVIVVTGCGGGGDDSTSTSANATVPQVTSPGPLNQSHTSTSTTPRAPGGNSTNPAGPPRNLARGAQPVQQALASFRDCLRRQGVSLPFLNGSAQAQQPNTNPEQYRVQVERAFKCIPELPPRLKDAAERFKRRFEQRTP